MTCCMAHNVANRLSQYRDGQKWNERNVQMFSQLGPSMWRRNVAALCIRYKMNVHRRIETKWKSKKWKHVRGEFDRRKMHSVHLWSCTWFSCWSFVFGHLLCHRLRIAFLSSRPQLGASVFLRVSFVCEIFLLILESKKRMKSGRIREIITDQIPNDGEWWSCTQSNRTDKYSRTAGEKYNIFFPFATQFSGFTSLSLSHFVGDRGKM